MANLVVAVNTKRKDAEMASHGFSMFVDPKRAKLQDAEISVMMEEEEPLADADAPPSNVQTMFMPSPGLPVQGQVAFSTASTASGSKCSEQTFSTDQAAEPMDVEVDLQQCPALKQQQPEQHAPSFFSGFF